jgi:hypothetical protein
MIYQNPRYLLSANPFNNIFISDCFDKRIVPDVHFSIYICSLRSHKIEHSFFHKSEYKFSPNQTYLYL